jgi:outer membrane protein assembly factor BamD (BamD/ComL family)
MRSRASGKTDRPKLESKSEITEAETKELLQHAIDKRETLADSELAMARMFLQNGRPAIAARRLREILNEFGNSAAAKEASAMLRKLKL